MSNKACDNCNCQKAAQITKHTTTSQVNNKYELQRQNDEYKKLILHLKDTLSQIEEPNRYDEHTINYYKNWADQLEIMLYYFEKRIELFILTEDIRDEHLKLQA